MHISGKMLESLHHRDKVDAWCWYGSLAVDLPPLSTLGIYSISRATRVEMQIDLLPSFLRGLHIACTFHASRTINLGDGFPTP
jgi:hypothetical protein